MSDSSVDSDKMDEARAEALAASFVGKDPKVRTDVRNLRQREDTAKYLRNLDPTSGHYDGKSRIMKDNPNPDLPENMQLFKGDNHVKFSGEAINVLKNEAFMMQVNTQLTDAKEKSLAAGTAPEVNAVAMPTQLQMLKKEYEKRTQTMKNSNLSKLLEQYGGEKHLEIPEQLKAAIDPVDQEQDLKSMAMRKDQE